LWWAAIAYFSTWGFIWIVGQLLGGDGETTLRYLI
jgi:hypothetical protein